MRAAFIRLPISFTGCAYPIGPSLPLAVMLMVAEMTGNLSMLAPAMIAVGIASIIVGDVSIYTGQVGSRADSPAHRLQLSFPLLSTLAVRQAMKPLALS